MALTQLLCRAQLGIEAPEVHVEVHISNGLPSFSIVGLPEAAVRESRDRVRSAIINSGFDFPVKKIIVNLAPADLPKEGGRYDLAIALGILCASNQLASEALQQVECYGELSLSGELRPVNGLIPALIACANQKHSVLFPAANQVDAAIIPGIDGKYANSLAEICSSLNGSQPLPAIEYADYSIQTEYPIDLKEVIGQQQAKRALLIAAAGHHHLLMMGPPGTGKSMLAQRLATILPPMRLEEALQTLSILSVSQTPSSTSNDWMRRPFRSPHHTVSGVALVGGGTHPKPGEISLAHNGVLFLDELTEFERKSLEVLREPLETGEIHISRASRQVHYPAQFQLVAAMNPCPGGCDSIASCSCSPEQISRYKNKLSAPFLDRIDLQIELPKLTRSELLEKKSAEREDSAAYRERVIRARNRQLQRQNCLNAQLSPTGLEQYCPLDKSSQALLHKAIDQLGLSARSYHRILKIARTIADLSEKETPDSQCISEAIGFRRNRLLNSRP